MGCAGAVVGVILIVLLWWWLSPPKHAFSLGFGRSFGEAEVFCQTVPAPHRPGACPSVLASLPSSVGTAKRHAERQTARANVAPAHHAGRCTTATWRAPTRSASTTCCSR